MAFIVALSPTLPSRPAPLTRPRPAFPNCISVQMTATTRRSIPLRGHELIRPPASTLHPTGPLSDSDLDFFFRNGYVIVPQLLSGQLLADVRASTDPLDDDNISITRASYDRLTFNVWDHAPIFRQVATASPLAQAVAQLLPASPAPRSRVVLKDAYFKLKGSKPVCNFHVDDGVFWPCHEDQPGPGINAWIALDNVDDDGGGLTIAPASHTDQYLDCRDAVKQSTCNMHETDPVALAKLESIAISPRFQPGDAILCTRWLFHRGNPFKKGSPGETGPGVRRYSARYMPGDAVTNPKTFENGSLVLGDPIVLRDADQDRYPSLKLD